MNPEASTETGFSLVAGGPLNRLLEKLGFVRPGSSRLVLRTVVSMLLTWFVLLALSATQGLAVGSSVRVPFLYDFAAYARYLLSIPLLILAEGPIGRELAAVAAHFRHSGLVAEADQSKYESAPAQSKKMRDSTLAEAVPFSHWPSAAPSWPATRSPSAGTVVDLYTTLARVGGAEVPKDRPIDGVDQLDFFLGKQETSNREGFPAYVADRLSAVKWRNRKVHFVWQETMYETPQKLPLPKVVNLLTDMKEERDMAAKTSWVIDPAVRIVSELEASLKKYPPIKVGTPDPYRPPK